MDKAEVLERLEKIGTHLMQSQSAGFMAYFWETKAVVESLSNAQNPAVSR